MTRLIRRARKLSGFWLAFLICSQLCWAVPALADPDRSSDPEDAEGLFRDGLRDMLAGQYAVGCPRLAKSYRSDPLPGVLFTLAECEARWKKLASALDHYQLFVSSLTSMPAERRENFEERRRIAAGQIAVLSVAAPELTVNAPANAPPTLVIEAGGVVLPPGSYGVGRRVDPGSYSVSAEVDGQRVWERTVTLGPSDHARVDVDLPPQLEPSRPSGIQPSLDKAPHEADAAHDADAAHEADAAHDADARHTWLYVAGGFGIAGLTTGLVSGALAYGHTGSIDSNCPQSSCNPKGRAALDSARSEARLSTVAFSIGIVGSAAALLLRLAEPATVTPSTARSTPRSLASWSIASDGSSVTLGGRF